MVKVFGACGVKGKLEKLTQVERIKANLGLRLKFLFSQEKKPSIL